MSSIFECNITISGQTFDISIDENKWQNFSFGYIYPKIREIAKIAANEDIQLSTHEFEIMDGTTKWRVDRMDQFIKHNSNINIIPKTLTNDQNLRQISFLSSTELPQTDVDLSCLPADHPIETDSTTQLTIDSTILEPTPQPLETEVQPNDESIQISIKSEEEMLKSCENEIKLFHSIVMSINIGWDLKGGKSNANWKKVHHHLSTVFKERVPLRKMVQNYYRWAAFYAQRYESIDSLLEPSAQRIFDLLKVIHTLDLDQLYRNGKSGTTAQKIREISETKRFEDYFKIHLSDIRHKKLEAKEGVKQKRISGKISDKKIQEINQSIDKTNDEKNEAFDKQITEILQSNKVIKQDSNKSVSVTDITNAKTNAKTNKSIPPESSSFLLVFLESVPQKSVSQNIKEIASNSVDINSSNIEKEVLINDKNETIDNQNTESVYRFERWLRKKERLISRNLAKSSISESNSHKKVKTEIETITIE